MKILCVSDQIDPLIYNQDAEKKFPDIDLILCAGDLPMDYIEFIVSVFNKPTYFIFGNHNLSEFNYYHGTKTSPAAALSLPEAAAREYEELTSGITHGAYYAGFRNICSNTNSFINPKTGKRTPLLITGISGSKRYNNGQNQYTDLQMAFKIFFLIPNLLYNKIRYGRYVDIFLTHASPFGVHDLKDPCHIGFKAFNWFLKKFKPSYMVHGHIHLYDQRDVRISKYEETYVVNAYAHCIIEFPIKKNN